MKLEQGIGMTEITRLDGTQPLAEPIEIEDFAGNNALDAITFVEQPTEETLVQFQRLSGLEATSTYAEIAALLGDNLLSEHQVRYLVELETRPKQFLNNATYLAPFKRGGQLFVGEIFRYSRNNPDANDALALWVWEGSEQADDNGGDEIIVLVPA